MKKYSVIVRGENFFLNLQGEKKAFGFVTTRKVKASSVQEAQDLAIEQVKSDEELRQLIVEEQVDQAPQLYVEEVYNLAWWKKLGGKGFTFFEDS